MRTSWLLLLAGCGFEPGSAPRGDGSTIVSDARDADGPTTGSDASGITADAGATPDAPRSCGTGYVMVAGAQTTSTYRKVNTPTLWATARTACEADGAHLIIPETQAEAVAVFDFVAPDSSSPYYWAGISDPELDDVWTTVLGATFASPPWAGGQPNQRTGEIHVLVAGSGAFYDFYNNAIQEYACECPP